jgi:hypothetical protein
MKWTKTTWNTFEERIIRGRNMSVNAWLVTGDGGGDLQVDIGTENIVYYLLFICLSSE